MKIGLVQIDGKFPNLALMKISTYERDMGNETELVVRPGNNIPLETLSWDKTYISVIFYQNKEKAVSLSRSVPGPQIGGSGYDFSHELPTAIEYLMPDYDLYDIDYSMGFTTRGCFRTCDFCIVPRKEGPLRENQHFTEFMHPDHNKLILMDNNILGLDHQKKFQEMRDAGIKINFCQGLDIRLVSETTAGYLADLKYYDWKFRAKRLHFAFDDPKDEPFVRRGIERLLDAGIRPEHLFFYVIVGFNTTFDQDYRRYEILYDEYGVYPFIMLYNQTKDRKLRDFARWVNRRVHKKYPFDEYDRGLKLARTK